MVWRCNECNMTFETQQLFDTHKRKFCVVDPTRLYSRISGKSANRNERKDKQESQTPLPDIKIRVHSSLSAPNTPTRTSNSRPENDLSKMLLGSGHHIGRHLSAPNTPTGEYGGISALEKEKIDQLKRFKTQQLMQRNSKNLEEKLLLTSIKDKQLQTPRRVNDERGDDRILQLTEVHRQQLDELRQRNEKLQKEKEMIAERMNSLGLKSRQTMLSQGSVDKQATELDGLKRYLDFKEEEEKRNFDNQQSKVNLLKVQARSPPRSAASEYVTTPEQQIIQPRRSPREPVRDGRGQIVPYHYSPVRYYNPAPIQFGQSSVLQELNMLKNEYFQKGGNDPEILAQMRELEYEAQRMQAMQMRPPAVDPLLQQQIMSFHLANQRLEQELQLLRDERNQNERRRSPDMDPEFKQMKEEHLVKMASLKQEAQLLRQQAEVEKMRKELKTLRGESLPLEENRTALESPFMMTNSSMDKELLPSPYDPNAGFVVYWDFVLGLSSSLSKCRLAAGIYQGAEIVTDVKLLPLVRTTLISKDSHPSIPPGGAGVIAIKHPFPRCFPDQNLNLVVELQANSAEDSDNPDELFSKGWTKIDLFDISNRLLSGRWKVPIRIAPIKAFLNTHELNKIPQVGQAELYLRLVNSRDVTSQDALNPGLQQHHMYKYPTMENIRVIPQVSSLPVSRGLQNFPPAPPPSVPPPPDTPGSVVQRAESAPRTPLDDSMVGFQVDKLIDAIPGEAKIKITVYEHEQGQVLKGNNSPIMCVTKSAKQDFLEGIYSFGLQEAQFKNVPWDANSIVVFRLYLQPSHLSTSGNSTAQAANLLDESKLAAWAALPLTLTAGSHASRRSRQSGDSRGGATRLNLGTHNLRLFFPPVVPVPNIPLRAPFPEQWSTYGQASLRVSIFSSSNAPPERPSSPDEYLQENDLPENVWIKNGRPSILNDEFEEGNGFDLYIDSARFLPDSVTVCKVAGRVLDKNYTRVGEDIDIQAELDSDIYNPEFNARLEYREPVFSPSCTLMLKVYTVDRIKKNLCCLGYGFLPIFIEVGTTNQPSVSSTEVKVALNEGPHQIRLYSGSPDLTQPLHESVAQTLPHVPCASLLVRLVQAACHPNGRPKEASEFTEAEWEAEGLFQPKPSYDDGEYYSLSCEPTLGECQIFHSMVKRQPIRTRDAIKLIGDGQEQKLKKDRVIESWIKTRLTRNLDALPGDLDLSYVALYHVMHGLKISVDGAQNLPWSNFTMVSYCLSPPGSFYKGTREDHLSLVTRPLYSSSVASPVWKDRLKVFPRRIYHRFMVVIIHLHELVVDTNQSKSSYSLQGQAWTAVQVFDEGYVMNGCYQLPLYAGDPPEVAMNALQADNCLNVLSSLRRRKAIKLVEGSSVYIRLADARRAEELPAPKTKAKLDYLPKERLDKYLNLNPSSSLSSLVPRGMTEDELTMELTDKFTSLANQLLGTYQKDTS